MDYFGWLTGRFSNRSKALSLYKRGIVRAKRHDHQGAIEDYSVTIDTTETPEDVRAMALYNRALVHVAMGDEAKGTIDLNALLAMQGGFVNIKTMARQQLLRMKRRSENTKDIRPTLNFKPKSRKPSID